MLSFLIFDVFIKRFRLLSVTAAVFILLPLLCVLVILLTQTGCTARSTPVPAAAYNPANDPNSPQRQEELRKALEQHTTGTTQALDNLSNVLSGPHHKREVYR